MYFYEICFYEFISCLEMYENKYNILTIDQFIIYFHRRHISYRWLSERSFKSIVIEFHPRDLKYLVRSGHTIYSLVTLYNPVRRNRLHKCNLCNLHYLNNLCRLY